MKTRPFDITVARLGQTLKDKETGKVSVVSHVTPPQGESDVMVRIRDNKAQTVIVDDPDNYMELVF